MIRSKQDYLNTVRGYQASLALLAATRLGLMAGLQSGPQSLVKLAALAGGRSPEFTRRLIAALEALGLVTESDSIVQLSEIGSDVYRDEACRSFAMYHAHCAPGWSRLEDVFRDDAGRGANFHEHLRRTSPDFVRAYLRAMEAIAVESQPFILANWNLSNCENVIDIGCGPATLTRGWLAMDRMHRRVTGIDLDPIPSIAIREFDYPPQFSWRSTDFMQLETTTSYDGIYCSHLLEYCPAHLLPAWISKFHHLASTRNGRCTLVAFLDSESSPDATSDRASLPLHAIASSINGAQLGTIHSARAVREELKRYAKDIAITPIPTRSTYPESLITFTWQN